MNLILASSSPRRQALLNQVHLPFTIRQPAVDESQITTRNPHDKVRALALLKNKAIALADKKDVIVSADTIVAFQGEIFGKPKNKEEATQMMSLLSGSVHEVYTGVMIRSLDQEIHFVEKTEVEFWPLSEEDISRYVRTNDPYDKAGAYGIQSLGAIFVKKIHGDYATVVGLPLSRLCRELKAFSIYPENEHK